MLFKKRFIFIFPIVFSAFVCAADAAPSVRVLGTKGNTVAASGGNIMASKASNTSTSVNRSNAAERPSAVRTISSSTMKPVTVNRVNQPMTVSTANVANTTGDSSVASTSRLSAGKYLHNAGQNSGAIKTVSAAAVTADAGGLPALADRVSELEARFEDGMASKQDLLSTGDGLYIEDNVLNLTADITDLVEAVKGLEENKADKSALDDYYTKEEASEMAGTVYDADTGTRKQIAIVDVFSEEIFNDLDGE